MQESERKLSNDYNLGTGTFFKFAPIHVVLLSNFGYHQGRLNLFETRKLMGSESKLFSNPINRLFPVRFSFYHK